MNPAILHPKVQQFITDNLKTDLTKLILKGSPFEAVSVQELANQIIAKKKAEQKLTTWFQSKNIYYPPKISIEQTSSEITAAYKANLISGNRIIDLTGGFGVDCFYFSKYFKEVNHCEINTELSKIVAHNFKQFSISNIHFFAEDGICVLSKTTQMFDYIYIDPSRRNDRKGKVFLLEDCLPNVPKHIDFLFSKSEQILIKNSPILDITSAIKELKFVKEIHIVAIENEVKELLFLLEKEYSKPIEIKTINILKKENQSFNFTHQTIANSVYSKPLNYLYEPNSAILKSGGFHQVSQQLNIFKIQQHSHVYTSSERVDFPGRTFKVKQVISYHKKRIKKLLDEGKANITVRNFPKTVAQIRKETKIKDGGNTYLFFTTLNTGDLAVIVCEKIK